jgi:hypothetical protein
MGRRGAGGHAPAGPQELTWNQWQARFKGQLGNGLSAAWAHYKANGELPSAAEEQQAGAKTSQHAAARQACAADGSAVTGTCGAGVSQQRATSSAGLPPVRGDATAVVRVEPSTGGPSSSAASGARPQPRHGPRPPQAPLQQQQQSQQQPQQQQPQRQQPQQQQQVLQQQPQPQQQPQQQQQPLQQPQQQQPQQQQRTPVGAGRPPAAIEARLDWNKVRACPCPALLRPCMDSGCGCICRAGLNRAR